MNIKNNCGNNCVLPNEPTIHFLGWPTEINYAQLNLGIIVRKTIHYAKTPHSWKPEWATESMESFKKFSL